MPDQFGEREEASLKALLPVAKEYGAAIIGLCMDDDGITHDPEKRLAIAEKIIERSVRAGIMAEDVIVDPLAMAVSADPQACLVTLKLSGLFIRSWVIILPREPAISPSVYPTGNP